MLLRAFSIALQGRQTSVNGGPKVLSPQYVYTHSTGRIDSVTWSADNKRIASATNRKDGSVQVWDSFTGDHQRIYPNYAGPVAWSPNGKYIASGGQYKLNIWDVTSGASYSITGATSVSTDVAGTVYAPEVLSWSPDSTHIASDTASDIVGIWSFADQKAAPGSPLASYVFRTPLRNSGRQESEIVALKPDPYGGGDHAISALAWSPHGRYIAVGSVDGRVWLDDTSLRSQEQSASRPVSQSASGVDSVNIASLNASWYDFIAHATMSLFAYNRYSYVTALGWSPKDEQFISAGIGDAVKVWDAQSQKIVSSYSHYAAPLVWSPNGKYIASMNADLNDFTVQIWEVITGNVVFQCKGHTDTLNVLCWSRDGKYLASASNDQTVRVWLID